MQNKKKIPAFSELLRALRIKHRYSIRKLEKATSVSRSYIVTLERGYDPRTKKEVRPSKEVIKRLGEVLGDSYDALMVAAGYLPDEVAASVVAEQRGHKVTERPKLTDEEIEEITKVVAEVTIEELRKRGIID
ncbi:MAG: helix-turn-helix transcriptional regulator [Dehalococcoidales bacterium]|nr:helix-turn-helix transcriptional regulator [Dehalococcoidales bacterium]